MVIFEVINTNNHDQTSNIVTAHDIVECSNKPMECAHLILSGFIIELFSLIKISFTRLLFHSTHYKIASRFSKAYSSMRLIIHSTHYKISYIFLNSTLLSPFKSLCRLAILGIYNLQKLSSLPTVGNLSAP